MSQHKRDLNALLAQCELTAKHFRTLRATAKDINEQSPNHLPHAQFCDKLQSISAQINGVQADICMAIHDFEQEEMFDRPPSNGGAMGEAIKQWSAHR